MLKRPELIALLDDVRVADGDNRDDAWRHRIADEAAKNHGDPFSDASGWLTPSMINNLLDEIEEIPQGHIGDPALYRLHEVKMTRGQAEIAARVQLHIGEKALLLQSKIAEDQQALQDRIASRADVTSQAVKAATNRLFLATVGLVIATVVLVIVTAAHH